jgi:hypothetical protein
MPKPVERQGVCMRGRQRIVASVAGLGLLVLILELASPLFLLSQARGLSQTRPYCLYVPNRISRGSHEVTRLRDLAWPHERESCGGSGSCNWRFEFHAVLAVESQPQRSLYNWSYSRLSFQPISADAERGLYLRPDRCRPRTWFLESLAW